MGVVQSTTKSVAATSTTITSTSTLVNVAPTSTSTSTSTSISAAGIASAADNTDSGTVTSITVTSSTDQATTEISTLTTFVTSIATSSSTTSSDTISSSATSSSTTSSSATSSSTSLPLPYTSTTIPASSTNAPQYVFLYGDSYTSTGFSISGTKPSTSNPMGNPSWPGSTSTGRNYNGTVEPNWVDYLSTASPSNTLFFDFAYGGAAVDNSLTLGANPNVPAFLNQSGTWVNNIGIKPHPSYAKWTAANSVHVIYFGRNDVYWAVTQNVAISTRLDAVMTSYINVINSLWAQGARRFVILGIPPMQREPLWSSGAPWNAWAPQVPTGVAYWTANLPKKLAAWKKGKPAVQLAILDTSAAYSKVLDGSNYQAWGLASPTCHNDDASGAYLPSATAPDGLCPFADTVHPGPALAKSIAITVGQGLVAGGVLSQFGMAYV